MNYEVRYVNFKNKNWNYLKVVYNNKTIIFINKKDLYGQVEGQHLYSVHK